MAPQDPKNTPRACVIGAGPCGLAATKALLTAGIDTTCFEMSDRVGGLWVFNNENGRSGAYRSLHINTSRKNSAFSDFPLPEWVGDYAHHEHLARYFDDYAGHFDLKRRICFASEVLHCQPDAQGGYWVTRRRLDRTGRPTTSHFDAVVVANGHHWLPAWPDPMPPGKFTGSRIHSHQYRDPMEPLDLRNQRVCVVGMGNSAMDIAAELSRVSRAVFLSARRGAWVIPKYLMGRPVDQGSLVPHFLPRRLRQRIVTRAFESLVGRMQDFGLPEPDHLLGEAHPTLSSDVPHLVAEGKIAMRGRIESFDGAHAVFSTGQREQLDAVVFCTGYRVAFPFFDASHVAAPENRLPLFHRVFHPQHRHVFFIGLAQPAGAIMPLAELQGRWVAAHLSGAYNLPTQADIALAMEEQARWMKSFVGSPRHTMQVEPAIYRSQLKREMRRGARRARRRQGIEFSWRRPAPSHHLESAGSASVPREETSLGSETTP